MLLLVNNGAKVDTEDAYLKKLALSSHIDPKIKQILRDNGVKDDDESKDSDKTKTPKTELSQEEKDELNKAFYQIKKIFLKLFYMGSLVLNMEILIKFFGPLRILKKILNKSCN